MNTQIRTKTASLFLRGLSYIFPLRSLQLSSILFAIPFSFVIHTFFKVCFNKSFLFLVPSVSSFIDASFCSPFAVHQPPDFLPFFFPPSSIVLFCLLFLFSSLFPLLGPLFVPCCFSVFLSLLSAFPSVLSYTQTVVYDLPFLLLFPFSLPGISHCQLLFLTLLLFRSVHVTSCI